MLKDSSLVESLVKPARFYLDHVLIGTTYAAVKKAKPMNRWRKHWRKERAQLAYMQGCHLGGRTIGLALRDKVLNRVL